MCHFNTLRIMRLNRKLIVLCAFLCALSSCKQTEYIPIHDTTYTVREVHDSTYVDRWHTIEVKGDTVHVRDSHMSVTYRTITDTAYKYIEKPVTVTVEQIKEVAKPLSWWQKALMWSGVAVLVVLLTVLLAKFWQLFRR